MKLLNVQICNDRKFGRFKTNYCYETLIKEEIQDILAVKSGRLSFYIYEEVLWGNSNGTMEGLNKRLNYLIEKLNKKKK